VGIRIFRDFSDTASRYDDFGGAVVAPFALEAAQTLNVDKIKSLVPVTESGVAVALSITTGAPIQRTLTPATETDKSRRLSVFKSALEIDRAIRLSVLMAARETDAAQTLDRDKHNTLGQAVESGSARPLVFTKTIFKALVACTETDSASGLSIGGNAIQVFLTPCLESDLALDIYFDQDSFLVFGVSAEDVLILPAEVDIFDNFNRADEGPPMAGWSSYIDPGLKVLNNQCAPSGSFSHGAYFSTEMGRNVEAAVTITVLPVTNGQVSVLARIAPEGASSYGSGYQVNLFRNAGPDDIRIFRVDTPGDVHTQLGSWPQELSNGDAIKIRCFESVIEAWVRLSEVWVLMGSVVDSTYSGVAPNNKVALGVFTDSAIRLDDFVGQTFIPDNDLSLETASEDILAFS